MIQVSPVTVEFEESSDSPFELIESPDFVLGDFNGDGFIDQAKIKGYTKIEGVAPLIDYYRSGDTTVSILLGDENGNFEAVENSIFTFDGVPGQTYIGHFNGDGNLDILVNLYGYDDLSNILLEKVTLLLGDGSGEFSLEETGLGGGIMYTFNVGDINLDGLDDIQLNYFNSLYDLDTISEAFLRDENGFNRVEENTDLAPDNNIKYFGYFNDDGFIDQVVADYSSPNNSTTLSVFPGNESGGFETDPTSILNFEGYPSLEIDDFNGDNNLDLAVETSENKLTFLLGDGEGGFSLDTEIEFEEGSDFNIADVDNDGLEDIISTTDSSVPTEGVWIFLGDGYDNYKPDQSIPLEDVDAVVAGDIDGDEKLDLAVVRNSFNNATGNYESQVEIFLQDEDGEFVPGETINFDDSFSVNELSLVDFNDDGNLDILVKDNYAVYNEETNRYSDQAKFILGEGNGEFRDPSPVIEVDNDNSPFTIGYFDEDGNFDAVVYTSTDNYPNSNGQLTVLLGDGNAGFTPASTVEIDNLEDFVPEDFNGDGDLDLLAYTRTIDFDTFTTQIQLEFFFGGGEGNLEAQPNLTVELDNFIEDLTAGDFNGDGNVDVIWESNSYSDYGVLLGEGDGEFSSPTILTPGNSGNVAIADFDGDGNLDYIDSSGYYSLYTVSVLLNQSDEDSDDGTVDTVESDQSYTLQPGEDNLILIGNSNIDGIGNELDNEITGNRRRNRLEGLAGNDTLNGGERRDTLLGGVGDDLLNGGDDRDSLIGGEGNDTLDGGNKRDTLIGGKGDDFLNGGESRDRLIGGEGDDNLTGGESRDVFVFATDEAFNTDIGVDTITDFDPDDDSIELSQTTFTAIESEIDDGFSMASEFAIVEDIEEVDTSEALIVYHQPTGELFYNKNSSVPGFDLVSGGGLFATFEDLPILESDNFTIIA